MDEASLVTANGFPECDLVTAWGLFGWMVGWLVHWFVSLSLAVCGGVHACAVETKNLGKKMCQCFYSCHVVDSFSFIFF